MTEKDLDLSPEAQEWHDLIKEVHTSEQPLDVDGGDPVDDVQADVIQGFRFASLATSKSGTIILAALVLLCVLIALVVIPSFGTDEDTAEPQAAETADATDAGSVDTDEAETADTARIDQEAAEAETDEEPGATADTPVELTDGPWRFFSDASEVAPLYDFVFVGDGTFYEHGAADTSQGTYTVTGDIISLALIRTAELSASNADGDERVETHSWNESFTMQRTGDMMTGDYQVESWTFSYDDGMKYRGPGDVRTGISARPQQPDDQG